jgi:hypothetical protein
VAKKPAPGAKKKAPRKKSGKGKGSAVAPAPPPDSEAVAAAVLAANTRFYRALTQGDVADMDALWDHGEDGMCVHPSGIILQGWEEIGDSWRTILEGSPPKVIPESERVSFQGDHAAVFCIERIISDAGMGLAGATNLFRLVDGEWRMLWHHSALLPSMM